MTRLPEGQGTVLDDTDRRLLRLLQDDSALTNQELAARAHVSPATALRRVRRLRDTGVIERQMAIVSPDVTGAGLTAILEVALDVQSADALAAFEAAIAAEPAVQQCYRVASGPDFVLIVFVPDMPAYHAFVHRALTAEANVRNVRSFFAVRRSKFAPVLPL
jgi:Lrp/AsnC family transcriptional regulator, leucine-responsive regulatory protein